MKDINDLFPDKRKITRAAILSLALSGMITLEAANTVLASTIPGDVPFTEEEFQKAREDTNCNPEDADTATCYTIIATDILDDGSIEAVLENNATGIQILMIDNEGDLEFDTLATLDGEPLDTKPTDLTITNLDEVLLEFKRVEPPMVIYGGPDMMDLYDPIEPDNEPSEEMTDNNG